MKITVDKSNEEKLLEKVEEEIVKSGGETNETIIQLVNTMKTMSETLTALKNSKFEYQASNDKVDEKEFADAYLLGLHRNPDAPRFKSPMYDRLKAMTSDAAFTTRASNAIFNEVENQLIIAPLFSTMNIDNKIVEVPFYPEDSGSIGIWGSSQPYESVAGTNTATSVQTVVSGITFQPKKFMAATHLSRDESEDVILNLVSANRASATRRLANHIDLSILRGDGSITTFTAAATTNQAPFKGFMTLASDVGGNGLTVLTGGNTTKANVQHIGNALTKLGKYGVNPSILRYITSVEGYMSLVQSPAFLSYDVAGPAFTLAKGSVGSILGVPVIVSGNMPVASANAYMGALVNPTVFRTAVRRGVELETDYDPSTQVEKTYISTRIDFKAMSPVASEALSNTYSYAVAVQSKA